MTRRGLSVAFGTWVATVGCRPPVVPSAHLLDRPAASAAEFPDLLALGGLPAAADDDKVDATFDRGSWQGWGLGDGAALGFAGPRLLAGDRWLAPRLLEFDADLEGSIGTHSEPGSLHQVITTDAGEVEITLRFASSRWVVMQAKGAVLRDGWTWRGSVFADEGTPVAGEQRVRIALRSAQDAEAAPATTKPTGDDAPARGPAIIVVPLDDGVQVKVEEDGSFELFTDRPSRANVQSRVAIGYRLDDSDANLDALDNDEVRRLAGIGWQQSEERWARWVANATTTDAGKPIADPRRRRVAVKALVTMVSNWREPYGDLTHAGFFPSWASPAFHGLWAWDSWKHAFAFASIDPHLAASQIDAMFALQSERGMVPDVLYRDGRENNWRNTKPPLAGWAVHEVWRRLDAERPDAGLRWLREVLPKLEAYHAWWYLDRDHDGDGLCEYGAADGTVEAAAWESGMDNAVRFDGVKLLQNHEEAWSMDRESVDLAAYLALEKRMLGALWRVLDDEERAAAHVEAADALEAKLRDRFFDEDRGWFFDRGVEQENGKWGTARGPEGWTPLFTGAANPEQADAVRDAMMDPKRFSTVAPFPTLDASEREFKPGRGYWRGPVWLDQAWFGLAALRRYGFEEDAIGLETRLIEQLEGLHDDRPIRETYDPRDGSGQNARHFSWSAAHLLLMMREQWPADPWAEARADPPVAP